MGKMRTKICKNCGKKFKYSLKHRIYCSIKCAAQGRKNVWLKHSRTTKGRATQQKYRQSGKAKASSLKRNYGLTIEQFNQMYVEQNGECAICRVSVPYDKINTDHNHRTGKIRGLLCFNCNMFLGHLEKNFKNLQIAICYLNSK